MFALGYGIENVGSLECTDFIVAGPRCGFGKPGVGGEGGVDGANIDCYRVWWFGSAAASESRHRHSKTYNFSKTTMTTRHYTQSL